MNYFLNFLDHKKNFPMKFWNKNVVWGRQCIVVFSISLFCELQKKKEREISPFPIFHFFYYFSYDNIFIKLEKKFLTL